MEHELEIEAENDENIKTYSIISFGPAYL